MWSAAFRSSVSRSVANFSVALAIGVLSMQASYAGPAGGKVVRGEGQIVRPNATTTNINQASRLIVVDWESFNVATDETVNFRQPSADAAALNRIFDQNPSQIFGSINANGRVLLINPNGLLFGQSASVNVGSLIASGLDIDPDAFMSGDWTFRNADGAAGGVIINHGLLQAVDGGSVSLFGGGVLNTGTILADFGTINLAAGKQVTVDFDGDGLIQFAVDGELLENAYGLDAAVSNEGALRATSGQILMSGASANTVFAQVVNNSGVIQANGVTTDGGRVFLTGTGGVTVNSGRIDAGSGSGDGGRVHVLGDEVRVTGSTRIDVSGATGGGEILVGGDYQGANPGVRNARNTTIEKGAMLRADATTNGDGGRVIVWSDGTTRFHGGISARGGKQGGDGGFAEISGAQHLQVTGFADLRATNGRTGTVLWDPGTVTICDDAQLSCTPDNTTDIFSDAFISTQLGTANVTLATSNAMNGGAEDINFTGAGIDISGPNALQLDAGRNINLAGTISVGSLALNFGMNGAGGMLDLGAVTLNVTPVAVGGGAGSDTIAGQASGHNWTVSGANSGTIDSTITFVNVENLVGGSGNDTFTINTAGSLAGSIDGGTGTDSLAQTGGANAWLVTGAGTGTVTDIAGGFMGVESVIGGSGVDTFDFDTGAAINVSGGAGNDVFSLDVAVTGALDGGADDDTFNAQGGTATSVTGGAGGTDSDTVNGSGAINVSGVDEVTSNGQLFSDMENVTGGVGDDVFTIASGATLSGSIDGDLGTDTLSRTDGANTWNLAGANAGSVTGIGAFSGIENLVGGSGTDDFVFADGASVTGTVTGGAGTDTLDYSSYASAITVDVATLAATGTGGFSAVENLAGGAATDTLAGANDANSWSITGTNAGNIDGTFTFSNVENLGGGTADDLFIFGATGSVSGLIDGGNHVTADSIDYTALGAVTVTLGAGIANIESLLGATGATLAGGSTWQITGADAGTVDGFSFSGFGSITGTAGADSFTMNGGTLSGTLDGLAGSDTLAQIVNATLAGSDANGFSGGTASLGGFAGIDAISGTGAGILTGANAAGTWTLDGTPTYTDGTGTLAITGFSSLQGGTAADTFNVTAASTFNLSGGAGADTFNLDAALTGALDGEAGVDTLAGTQIVNATLAGSDINGFSGGNAGVSGGFSGIDTIDGAGGGTLTGRDVTSAWSVTAADTGSYTATQVLNWTGFANIIGGSGADSFVLNGGTVSGSIAGGAGTDTLTGDGTANGWSITGSNAGSLNGTGFSGMENLVGGASSDDFAFQSGGSVSGNVAGGAGTDTLDYGALATGIAADLGAGTASHVGSFSGIEALAGSSSAADVLTGVNDANTWTITGANAGSVDGFAFSGVENLTGGMGADTFNLGFSVAGTVSGGDGDDVFNYTDGVTTGALTGDAGTDTLAGDNVANAWALSGADSGSLNGQVFSGMERLAGGSADDRFVIANGVTFAGTVDGNGGADTLDWNGYATARSVTLSAAGATDGFDGAEVSITGGFFDMDAVTGAAGQPGTLTGVNAGAAWNITGADAGSYQTAANSLAFTGFGNLSGGSGDDTFVLVDGGSLSGLLTGGAETASDTLDVSGASGETVNVSGSATHVNRFTGIESIVGATALAGGSDWRITALDSGSVDGLAFSNVANISGTAGADRFTFTGTGAVTGSIDGFGGTDTIDMSGYGSASAFTLSGAGGTDGFGGTETVIAAFDDINAIIGATGQANTLAGMNAAATWTVAASDAGTYSAADTLSWGGFGSLLGGAGDDTFIFTTGSLSGTISGGGETTADTLNYSSYSGGAVTADLQAGSVTATGGFAGLEALTGSGSTADRLIGANDANAWSITGTNAGSVDGFVFTAVENLTGGTGSDSFGFQAGGLMSGDIAGGTGTDTLDYSALATAITVDLVTGTASHLNGTFSGVEVLTGSGSTGDTLGGANDLNTWTLTGTNAGSVDGFDFSAIENLAGGTASDTFNLGFDVTGAVLGGDGNDTFNYTNGAVIGALAGGAGTDTLAGDNVANTWIVSGANSGTLNGQSFLQVENLAGGSNDDVFRFTGTGSVGGTVSGGGQAGADTLDYGGYTGGAASVNLASGVATGTGGFVGIEAFAGSGSAGDTLTGADDANTWTVSADNAGDVDGFAFSGVENLAGGGNADQFNLSAGVSGTISGAGGADVIDVVAGFTAPGAQLGLDAETISNSGGGVIRVATLNLAGTNVGAAGAELLTDVDTLSLAVANAFITETDVLNVAGSVSNDLALGAGTGIAQVAALSVAGVADLLVTAGDILLDHAGNDFGTVTVSQAGNVTLADLNSIDLGAMTPAGFLDVSAAGNITTSGNIVATAATLTAGGSLSLDNTLTTTAGAVTLSAANTAINQLVAAAGGFSQTDGPVSLGANITTTGSAISFDGPLTLTNDIVLNTGTAAAVRFASAVNGGGRNLALDAGGGTTRFDGIVSNVAALDVAGGAADVNASIEAGTLTFAGNVDLASGVGLTASTGAVNIAGNLHTSGSGATSVVRSAGDRDIVIGSVSGSHSLTVQSARHIAIGGGTGSVNLAAGTANLQVDVDGDFAGASLAVGSISAGEVRVSGTGDDVLNINTLTASGGSVIIDSAMQLGRNLVVNTNNGFFDANGTLSGARILTVNAGSGSVEFATVNGLAGIDVSAGNITFHNSATVDAQGVTLDAGNNVLLSSGLATTAGGTITIANGGTLTVNGAINSDGAVVQTGGSVDLNADIVTTNDTINLAGNVDIGNNGARLAAGSSLIVLRNVSGSGSLELDGSNGLRLGGVMDIGELKNDGLSGTLQVSGNARITTNDTDLALNHFGSIQAASGGGSLTLDAGTANVVLPTIGNTSALGGLAVNGGNVRIGNVMTSGNQRYSADRLRFSGTQAAGNGNIDVNGAVDLLGNTTMDGNNIAIHGGVNGASTLNLIANGHVTVDGTIGGATALAGLNIVAGTGSLDAVITQGAQIYDAAMTVNGNLTGGSIAFEQSVEFPGGAIVESDTIDFNGGTGSVTGGGELTLIPLTDGADVSLGGTGADLDLDASALDGYDAGLVIGGIVTPGSITTRADQVTASGEFSVGENGYLTLVSRGGIVLRDGVVSGDTLTLIAADPSGMISNGSSRGSDSLLQANTLILVAGGEIGEADGNDINVVSLSRPGQLEVASGAVEAFVNNIGNSFTEAVTPVRALAIARQLNLAVNTNLQITSSAQNSANREQSSGLADEGFIDPSLFEDIALYEISGTGITLPADQSEEGSFDEGPTTDCDSDEQDCGLEGVGAVGVTSPH